jgi:transposase
MRFDLSDEEWALLAAASEGSQERTGGRPQNHERDLLRLAHMPWRDLPERYGPYTTAYNRFNRWSRRGI